MIISLLTTQNLSFASLHLHCVLSVCATPLLKDAMLKTTHTIYQVITTGPSRNLRGFYSLSVNASYRKISRSLITTWLCVKIINRSEMWQASRKKMLPRRLSNFKSIGQLITQWCRVENNTRYSLSHNHLPVQWETQEPEIIGLAKTGVGVGGGWGVVVSMRFSKANTISRKQKIFHFFYLFIFLLRG